MLCWSSSEAPRRTNTGMRLERFVANCSQPNVIKAVTRALIVKGVVTVDGHLVTPRGWQVFLGNGGNHHWGELVPILAVPRLFVLHKPAGVMEVLDRDLARKKATMCTVEVLCSQRIRLNNTL